MSKLDLKAFSFEALSQIMAIRPSLMTKEQVQVYKKVKLENWLAKKDGKPAPWNFPSAKGGVSKASSEKIQDIDISKLVESLPVEEEVETTVPVSASVFNEKIPSWQKIPDKIDIQDLLGRMITCKIDNRQQICKIMVNDKGEIYLHSEGGVNCSVPLPHIYRAWKYATVLLNPPRIELA